MIDAMFERGAGEIREAFKTLDEIKGAGR